MSKYLVKILTICAFAILLPLVAVGAALCVTEARGSTLTVYADGNEGTFGGANSAVSIIIDGEKQEDSKITVKKNTEVTVVYEGTGYDFVGWYDKNYAEINRETDEKFAETESYSFILRGDTVLTAVRDVKTYHVTYAGTMDDGVTPITLEAQEREYNQPLNMDLEATEEGVVLSGWYTPDSTTSTTRATFANSGDITVYPRWSNEMLITYVKADETVITTEKTTQEDFMHYTLLTGTDANVEAALTRGYAFDGWDYQGDTITSIPEFKVEGYKLYLKEKVKTYNITVKYNAVSSVTDSITYKIDGTGYSAYSKKDTRSGYEFKGFAYAGDTYTWDIERNDYVCDGATLSSIIVENGNITVTAVWECELKYGFILAVKAWYEEDGEWLAKANGGEWAAIENIDITFEDTETGYDLNNDIYSMLTSRFANFTKQERHGGDPLSYKDIDYVNGNILVFVGNHGGRTRFARSEGDYTLTFGQLVSALLASDYTLNEIDGESITVCFMYA